MAKGSVSFTLFDQILHQQPPILELVKHANTDDWFNLGIHLQLNEVKLNKCMGDLSRVYSFGFSRKGKKQQGGSY